MKKILFTLLLAISTLAYSGDTALMYIQTGPGGLLHKYGMELSPALADATGYPVVVDFKPGGNGIVAARALMEHTTTSPPSFMFGFGMSNTDYNQLTDIKPVLDIGTAPAILIASQKFGYKSLKEVLKNPPGRAITIGVAAGTANAYWADTFAESFPKLNIIVVPYKTGTNAMNDILVGVIDMSITSVPVARGMVDDGKVTALANVSSQRAGSMPSVPTVREEGARFKNDFKGFNRLFLWTQNNVDTDTVDKIQKRYLAWAKSKEAHELFDKMDIGVSLDTLIKPEIALTEFQK